MQEKVEELRKKLDIKNQNIVIVSHRNPDGDAMGATCALYNYFTQLGHQVHMVVPNNYPQFLNWLPKIKETLIYEWHRKKCNQVFKQCDILFAVDFNGLSRIREFQEQIAPVNCYKVLIDHHPNPEDFADIMLHDTSASSTCELVYLFLKSLNGPGKIDQEIGECIYTGIMTDTGNFNFNSSKRQTFEIVGDLLDLGIRKDKIFSYVYNNYSVDRMRLMGHCLHEMMEYLPDYNTAFIKLTQEDIRKYNFKVGDSEGFVNIPLSIKGVVMSVLFTEKDDVVKLSLRSKGNFAVNEIANTYFNGGGHVNAAGGESSLSIDETIKKFKTLLENYKSELADGN